MSQTSPSLHTFGYWEYYRELEYLNPTLPQLQEYLHILGWEINEIREAGDEEWRRYLEGTGNALKWYNSLHPFNDNLFVKAEEEWTRSLEETNRKWIRFIHAVIKERR